MFIMLLDFIETIQPYLITLKDLATIISLAIAACVAIKGLKTWKEQLAGTAEYELAKRVLKATYYLRDALASVRAPFMSAAEQEIAWKQLGWEISDSDPNMQDKKTAATFYFRFKKVEGAFENLYSEAVEAEALWGSVAREKILKIQTSINKLSAGLNLYLRYLQNPNSQIRNHEMFERMEKIAYKMTLPGEEDEFTKELTTAINDVESFVQPYIKSRRRKSN